MAEHELFSHEASSSKPEAKKSNIKLRATVMVHIIGRTLGVRL